MSNRTGTHSLSTLVFVVVTLTAVAIWLLAPLSTHPASMLYSGQAFGPAPFAEADVQLNAWILAWGSHALANGNFAGFFDANIFWPAPNALAYSEHMLGVLPIFAPIYLLTGNLALSLNLWTLSTFVLSGMTTYWVSLRMFGSHPAAAVAAVFSAFAPWRFFELMHVQTLSTQYLPLLVYAAWLTAREPSFSRFGLLCGTLTLQVLSSYYLAYVGFLVVGVTATAGLLTMRRESGKSTSAAIVALALAAAAPTLVLYAVSEPYLQLEKAGVLVKHASFYDPVNTLVAFLLPGLGVVPPLARFAWLIPVLLAVVGTVIAASSKKDRIFGLAMTTLVVVSLVLALGPSARVGGIDLGDPYRIATRILPGWSSLRVHVRFAIAAWVGIGFLSALTMARITAKPTLAKCLASVCILPFVLATASISLTARAAPEAGEDGAAYRWLKAHGGDDPVIELPIGLPSLDARYEYLSTFHWSPLLNGYSGYRPRSYELVSSLGFLLPDRQALATLTRLDVTRWILVHTDTHWLADEAWEAMAEGGAIRRYRDERTQIYELPYRSVDLRPSLLPDTPGTTLLGTPLRRLSDAELQADIAVADKEKVTSLGAPEVGVRMFITNLSTATWPAIAVEADGLVGLEFQAGVSGGKFADLPGFTRLPTDLEPGGSTAVTARVKLPPHAGSYETMPCVAQANTPSRRCYPDAVVIVHVR